MSSLQILVSGDYWHEIFREPFSRLEVPATMVPLERINSIGEQSFQLIVLAQSRREQISQATVDSLRAQMPDVPIVVLLGSWCEGENRSGKPLLGVNQVPWQQWQSQFERFCTQVNDGVKSEWHQPLTATVSDKVRDFSPDQSIAEKLIGKRILVSSEDITTFESLADMLNVYQCFAFWAESPKIAIEAEEFAAICVDGNGASDEFQSRISELKSKFENAPLIAMLNFPRTQDLESLLTLGVEEVVSKPYTHNDFLQSLLRAMGKQHSGSIVPKPSMLSKKPNATSER